MADRILPIVAIVPIVTVEYGGWALLTFISGRHGLASAQHRSFEQGTRMPELHMAAGAPESPWAGTKITRAGALLIGAPLLALAVGLISTA